MATTYRRKPTKAELRRQQMEELVVYPIDWLEERSGLDRRPQVLPLPQRPVGHQLDADARLGRAHRLSRAGDHRRHPRDVLRAVGATDPHTGKPVAWESIVNITDHVYMGWLVRGMHKWGASVFIILMFLHMGRVFLFGAYKYPRELNWIVGVLILVSGMMEGFTGYLLPWDQTAYWASVVGINLNGTAPFLGPWLAQFLRGGQEISGDTLTRFYSLHMLVIPGAIIALITLHLYLVIRLGVTSPPWSKEAAGGEPDEEEEPRLRSGLTRPVAPARTGCRPSREAATDGCDPVGKEKPSRTDAPRAEFARYKADVKKRGKPFFPYAMFHDTVMSLVVVCDDHRARGDLEVDGVRARITTATHKGLLGPEVRSRRPIPARRASCRGRTGTSTSSSTCSGSSSGRSRSSSARSAFRPSRSMLLIALPFLDRRRARQPLAAAGRHGRRRPRRSSRWACSRGRARPRRRRSLPRSSENIPRWIKDEHLPPTRCRGRSSSRPRAARPATRTTAQAARTSARPT